MNSKTLAIKAKLTNKIRTTLYKKKLSDISPEDKVKIFDEIFSLNREIHNELNDYKWKRKYKAAIHKARLERGYKWKKKTSKKDYLESSR